MKKSLWIVASLGVLAALVALRSEPRPAAAGKSPRPSSETYFGGSALEVVPHTTPELVHLAHRIALAEVKQSHVGEALGNIFTFTDFKVVRMLKGAIADGDFTLRLHGGRMGDREIEGVLKIDFHPGERFILFLGKDNASGYPTILPSALFRVRKSAGTDVVEPSPAGLTLYRAKDHTQYQGHPELVPLDDFLYSLERVVAER
jgi:hypothetical protein